MGNKASTTLQNYVTNNVNYQTVVTAQLTAGNTGSISSSTTQNLSLQVGGADCCAVTAPNTSPILIPGCTPLTTICGGQFNATQLAGTTQFLFQSTDNTFSNQVAANLMTQTTNDISNSVNNLQESDFTNAFPNKTKTDVISSVTNSVSELFSSSTTLSIINNSLNNNVDMQTMTLTICAPLSGSACDFTQNASTNIMVQNVLTSVANLAASNTAISSFYNAVTNAVTNTQKGLFNQLADAFANFLKLIGGFGAVILGIGLLLLFILIAIGLYTLFKHPKETSQAIQAIYPQMYRAETYGSNTARPVNSMVYQQPQIYQPQLYQQPLQTTTTQINSQPTLQTSQTQSRPTLKQAVTSNVAQAAVEYLPDIIEGIATAAA